MTAMPGYTLFPSITPTRDSDGVDDDPPDAEQLADQHYQETVVTIRAGDADEVLDALEELDDRQTVLDAIEKRRDVLEED